MHVKGLVFLSDDLWTNTGDSSKKQLFLNLCEKNNLYYIIVYNSVTTLHLDFCDGFSVFVMFCLPCQVKVDHP